MTTSDELNPKKNPGPPKDTVPFLKSEPPSPEFTFRVDADAAQLVLEYKGSELATVPYTKETVYSLPSLCENKNKIGEFANGIRLDIGEKDMASLLGFETLLQITMMNMVACIFPARNMTIPRRNALPMHSMEAEINYIRNAPDYHNYNHAHILENQFKGLPLLMALPGPSLDLEYIRDHRDSFILMGVGRAAGKLIEAEIYPDLIYFQDVNARAWELSYDQLGDKRIPSTIIANPLGRLWKYKHNFKRIFKAWNLYLFEHDQFPRVREIAPSSVSGAYSLAKLLGFSSVLFVGNDCGVSAPPLDTPSVPERFTNLPFERRDDRLLFSPVTYSDNLRFSFGDALSIETKSEYLAGAQWLKSEAFTNSRQGGPALYDRSQTRQTQFNSPIRDAAEYVVGGPVSMPQLPFYEVGYDIKKYLMSRQTTYQFIAEQLHKKTIPPVSLDRPFSSIYNNTRMAALDTTTASDETFDEALKATTRLLEHIRIAMDSLG